VLWVAIKALEELSVPMKRKLRCVIFTGDVDASAAEMLAKAKVLCVAML
jgi:hypothetical protein